MKGVEVQWGKGIERVCKAWERLCQGDLRGNQGLVFDLD